MCLRIETSLGESRDTAPTTVVEQHDWIRSVPAVIGEATHQFLVQRNPNPEWEGQPMQNANADEYALKVDITLFIVFNLEQFEYCREQVEVRHVFTPAVAVEGS